MWFGNETMQKPYILTTNMPKAYLSAQPSSLSIGTLIFIMYFYFLLFLKYTHTLSQALQQEQEQEISQLEWQLEEMKFQHEDKVRRLKTQFLTDKRAFEEATEDFIRTEAQRTSKVISSACILSPGLSPHANNK